MASVGSIIPHNERIFSVILLPNSAVFQLFTKRQMTKFLDWSKLKPFAADKINLIEELKL